MVESMMFNYFLAIVGLRKRNELIRVKKKIIINLVTYICDIQ